MCLLVGMSHHPRAHTEVDEVVLMREKLREKVPQHWLDQLSASDSIMEEEYLLTSIECEKYE